jgi:hypothetical protein
MGPKRKQVVEPVYGPASKPPVEAKAARGDRLRAVEVSVGLDKTDPALPGQRRLSDQQFAGSAAPLRPRRRHIFQKPEILAHGEEGDGEADNLFVPHRSENAVVAATQHAAQLGLRPLLGRRDSFAIDDEGAFERVRVTRPEAPDGQAHARQSTALQRGSPISAAAPGFAMQGVRRVPRNP